MKCLFLFFLVLTNVVQAVECRTAASKIAGEATPSMRTGVEQLRRFIRISKNSPENVQQAESVLQSLTLQKINALIEKGQAKLRDKLHLPKVANNLEHVENQHLKPLAADANRLESEFGIDAKKLELLMVAHDLGKVEIPPDLLKALNALFPNDFLAREILSHEYASMYWIEKLGKESGMSPQEIHALQTLISNHNFGPDLTRAGNEELNGHWWPTMFRTKFIPKLKSIGIEIGNYGSAEGGVYSTLLSAYDRAIANEFNSFGLSTWQKFAEQDYNTWQGNLKYNPTLESPFNGPSLVDKMKLSAQWAEGEIDSLWNTLKDR